MLIIIYKDVLGGAFVTGYVLYRLLIKPALSTIILGVCVANQKKKQSPSSISDTDADADTTKFTSSNCYFQHLPKDIAERILTRLPLNDYLQFGTVCQSWRSFVSRANLEKRCTFMREAPLLMFCAHPYMDNRGHRFLDLTYNRDFYKPNCPQLRWQHCSGSVDGWLILSYALDWRPHECGSIYDFVGPHGYEWVKNYMLNPVSGVRITLPSQTTISFHPSTKKPNFLYKVEASTVPTSPNCVVVAIDYQGGMSLCRPSDDSWTRYENKEEFRYKDAVFHDGRLYAITNNRAMHCITIFDGIQKFKQGGTSPKANVIINMPSPRPADHGNSWGADNWLYSYGIPSFTLVKDQASNELLMIRYTTDSVIHLGPPGRSYSVPPKIISIEIYTFDQSGPQWVRVHSLGDRIVFLGTGNCMIISAGSIPKIHNKVSGDSIIFAIDYAWTKPQVQARDVGVFSLADGSIKRNIPAPRPWSTWWTIGTIWFMPYPW